MKIAMNVEKIIGLRKWDIMTEKKVIKFGDKYIFSIFVDEKGRAQELLYFIFGCFKNSCRME